MKTKFLSIVVCLMAALCVTSCTSKYGKNVEKMDASACDADVECCWELSLVSEDGSSSTFYYWCTEKKLCETAQTLVSIQKVHTDVYMKKYKSVEDEYSCVTTPSKIEKKK